MLLDEDRIGELTEIGTIDGGEFFDVLFVSYGPNDRTLRIRDELTLERRTFSIAPDVDLDELLNYLATDFALTFHTERPYVAIYRGHQARKWLKRFLRKARQVLTALPPNQKGSGQHPIVPISPEEIFVDPDTN